MNPRNTLILSLETVWWLATALVVWAVLRPIHQVMYDWPFEGWNTIFIVTLITLARYVFLLEHTFLARRQVLKIVLMLAMFPFTFLLINGLNQFLGYIGDHTWAPLTGHLPVAERSAAEDYIWGEMLFFAVGSIISAPVFAVRMMISVWRVRNRDTV